MTTRSRAESGSIIVWIFIAIALFAALGFTVAQMMRSGGSGDISAQKAQLAASEIIAYGQAVKAAIHALRINGCADNSINFNAAGLAGYNNPNAPGDGSCDIFALAGGGLTVQPAEQDWLDSSFSADTDFGNYFYTVQALLHGTDHAGTAQQDLVLILPYLKEAVCTALNQKLHSYTMPGATENDGPQRTKFAGDFSAGGGGSLGDSLTEAELNGCVLKTGAGGDADTVPANSYTYFQMLLTR